MMLRIALTALLLAQSSTAGLGQPNLTPQVRRREATPPSVHLASAVSANSLETIRPLDLAWLLAPSTAASFFATQYGHDLLHLRANAERDPDRFAPLRLTTAVGLEAAVNALKRHEAKRGGRGPPLLKVYRDGAQLPSQVLPENASAAGLRTSLGAGESFVLRLEEALRPTGDDFQAESQPEDPLTPLRRLRSSIEARLLTTASVHLYLSATGSDVLRPHTDPYDVFVLQLEGRKRWQICVPPSPPPGPAGSAGGLSRGERAALHVIDRGEVDGCSMFTVGEMLRMSPCRSITLAPGDALYLPKGLVHVAHTLDDSVSTHLTFGIQRRGRRWRDLVAALAVASASTQTDGDDALHEIVLPALEVVAQSGVLRAKWNAMVPLRALACDRSAEAASSPLALGCIDFARLAGDAGAAAEAVLSLLLQDLQEEIDASESPHEATVYADLKAAPAGATSRMRALLEEGVARMLDSAAVRVQMLHRDVAATSPSLSPRLRRSQATSSRRLLSRKPTGRKLRERRRLDCAEGKTGACPTGVSGYYYANSCDWCCCGGCGSECDDCGGCGTYQQCYTLAAPTNGATVTYTGDRRYSSAVATYSCNAGFYRSSGDATRTCNIAGSGGSTVAYWSGTMAGCTSASCPTLSPPTHGATVTYAPAGTRRYGTAIATYSCDAGYALTAPATRGCTVAGVADSQSASWDGIAPTCVAVACATLAAPTNGQAMSYTNDRKFPLGKATYSCISGYYLIGNSMRTCNVGGTGSASWSAVSATTTCAASTCPIFATLTNGNAVYSTPAVASYPASTVTFSCVNGYSLVGFAVRTCSSPGAVGSQTASWDTTAAPQCVAKTCDPLDVQNPDNGNVQLSLSPLSYPDATAAFTCGTGFGRSGPGNFVCGFYDSGTDTVKWMEDGSTAAATAPTCSAGTCNAFNTEHGLDIYYAHGHTNLGAQAYFTCKAGYARVAGGTVSNCAGVGAGVQWDAEPPTCQACEPGTFAPRGAVTCTTCIEGFFALYNSSGLCTMCPPGFECTEASKSICNKGYYSRGGATTCSACVRGSYGPSSGASECKACNAGSSCGGKQIQYFRQVDNTARKQVTCTQNRRLASIVLPPLNTSAEKDTSAAHVEHCEQICLNTSMCTHIVLRAGTVAPTAAPTAAPTVTPTAAPTVTPTAAPTASPTTTVPTSAPTSAPTQAPSSAPTTTPSNTPTSIPTTAPTKLPTPTPTHAPSTNPTTTPTFAPTNTPTKAPVNGMGGGGRRRRLLQNTSALFLSVVCDVCRLQDDEVWNIAMTELAKDQFVEIFEGVTGAASNQTLCVPGTFAPDSALAECPKCSNGTFNSVLGATTCKNCGAGNWSSTAAGLETCSVCGFGKFSPTDGSSACFVCAPGLHANRIGSTVCSKCKQGKFAPTEASSICTDCDVAKSAQSEGATACSPCEEGKFSNTAGSEECSGCDAGFISAHGASACRGCDVGKAAATTGSAVCTTCNEGRFSFRNASLCFKCPSRGVKCAEGKLIVKTGYWYDKSLGEVTDSTTLYQCSTGYCEDSASGFQCKMGHTGNLCGVCLPDYALTGLSCTHCISTGLATFITIVLVAACVIILIVLVQQRIASALKRARGGKRSLSSSIQRIFMTYAQTVSILSASKTQPPEAVTKIVATTASFTDGISASAYPVQCALRWDYYSRVYLYMLTPIAAFLIPLLLAVPLFVIFRICFRPLKMQMRLADIEKSKREQHEADRAAAREAGALETRVVVSARMVVRALPKDDEVLAGAAPPSGTTEKTSREDGGAGDGSGDGAEHVRSKTRGRGTALFNLLDVERARKGARRTSYHVYDEHFRAATKHAVSMTTAEDEVERANDSEARDEFESIDAAALSAILPPGIKIGDVERMVRKFGVAPNPLDPDAEKVKRKSDTASSRIAKKMRKGIAKRKRMRELKKMGKKTGNWAKHVDLKRGSVFYINSRTLERRSELPMEWAPNGIEMTVSPMSNREQRCVGDGDIEAEMTVSPMSKRSIGVGEGGDGDGKGTSATPYLLDYNGFARLYRHLENQKIWIAVVTTLVITQYFMYMRVTRSLIEIFAMTTINGKRFLTRSLADAAYTQNHKIAMALGTVSLVLFTVGMPIIGFGVVTWMHRTGRHNDPRWRTAFGFLSDGYKRKYFWWEAVVLLRKLALLLLAIATNDSFLQAFGAVFVLSVGMLMQAQFQPYADPYINQLDLAAMATVYLTRLGAILFHHLDPNESQLKDKCEDAMQIDCRGNRIVIANWIAGIVIALHVVLIVCFGIALLAQKGIEMKLCDRIRACVCKDADAKAKTKAKEEEEKKEEGDFNMFASDSGSSSSAKPSPFSSIVGTSLSRGSAARSSSRTSTFSDCDSSSIHGNSMFAHGDDLEFIANPTRAGRSSIVPVFKQPVGTRPALASIDEDAH